MIAAYYTHHNTDIVLAIAFVILVVLVLYGALRESKPKSKPDDIVSYYCINGHIGWDPFDDQPEVVCGEEYCPYGSREYDPLAEGIHRVWRQSDGVQVRYYFDGKVRTWK